MSMAKILALVLGLLALFVVAIAVFGVWISTDLTNSTDFNVLQVVPDNVTDVTVWDVETVLTGDVPDEMLNGLESEFEDAFEDVGIDLYDIDELVEVYGDNGSVTIIEGDFELDEVWEELEDANYRYDEYRGSPLWQDGRSTNWRALAWIKDTRRLVMGDTEAVRDVLRSTTRDSGFLFDDQSRFLTRAVSKAGRNLVVFASDNCEFIEVDGCRAFSGTVASGENGDHFEFTYYMLFRNERTAGAKMLVLEEEFENDLADGADIVEVSVDGDFVVIRSAVDEDELQKLWFLN